LCRTLGPTSAGTSAPLHVAAYLELRFAPRPDPLPLSRYRSL